MEKLLGVVWVQNARDALLCSWVMLRAEPRLPKDMRRYLQRYMYDSICAATPIFIRLDCWTGAQQCIYRTLLAQSSSTIPFSGEREASCALAGIAVALALCGKMVAIISCSVARNRLYAEAFCKYLQRADIPVHKMAAGHLGFPNGGNISWQLYIYALPVADCYLFDYRSNDRRLFPDILQPQLIIYST